MKLCGTQRLETDRLILRRYVIEDAAAMYKNWAIVLKDNGDEPIGDACYYALLKSER